MVPEVSTFQVEGHIVLLQAFHFIRAFLPVLSLNQFPCNFHPGIGHGSSFRSHREQFPFSSDKPSDSPSVLVKIQVGDRNHTAT